MEYLLHILVFIWIYVILAASLNLVAGYTGMMSVAHATFFGIGAYGTAIMAMKCGTPFFLNLACSAGIAWAVAAAISLPTTRVRDDYFVIATLAFQVIAYSIMLNLTELTGGAMGLPGIPQPTLFGVSLSGPLAFFVLATVIGLGVLWLCQRIADSPVGRVLKAIREDETYASVMGKDVVRYKVFIFSLAAMMASLAGGIYATYVTFIDPSSFTLMESVFIICLVIVGGSGTLLGPVIGAIILVVVPEILRFVGLPSAVAANIRQLSYGLLLVVFMLVRPRGLMGKDIFREGAE